MLYRLAVSPGSRALQGMPARRGPAGAPPAGRHPRRGAGLPARARARVARGPLQRRPPLRPSRGCATTCWPRCVSCRPRPSARSPRRPVSCARRPRCWTRAVDDALEGPAGGPGRDARRPARAAAGGAAACCCAGWPSGPPGAGRPARCPAPRPRRSWRWATGAPTRSTSAAGLRAVAEYGVVRFVRGPEARGRWPRRAAGAGAGAVRRLGDRGCAGRRRRGDGDRRGLAARRASLAGRRPHAPAGAGRQQVAAGPVHRPQGPAGAAAHAAGGGGRGADRLGGRRGAGRALRGRARRPGRWAWRASR